MTEKRKFYPIYGILVHTLPASDSSGSAAGRRCFHAVCTRRPSLATDQRLILGLQSRPAQCQLEGCVVVVGVK